MFKNGSIGVAVQSTKVTPCRSENRPTDRSPAPKAARMSKRIASGHSATA